MKKSVLILLLVLSLLLAACGTVPDATEPPTDPVTDPPTDPVETIPETVDVSDLQYFDLGCGLEMYAAPGIELLYQEGFAAYLADADQTISVLRDRKGEGVSLEDYAASYVDGEKIVGFEMDPWGNLAATYAKTTIDGTVFQFYVVAKETDDSFWMVFCACNERAVDRFYADYPRWCSTIAAVE